ncbi:MAG: hypothetical protein SFW66_04790, partial [Gammaproteobacteria bacterium]|nr:hypothetical protein [Gammaproteobacteria bacterium]
MKMESIWEAAPSLDNLNESLMHILYTYTPKSDIRSHQIDLLKSIAERGNDLNPDIIIGALLFIYDSIEQTYKHYTKVYTFFNPPESSDLYKLIKKSLSLDLHHMDDSCKFIYLSRFRKYLQENEDTIYLPKTIERLKALKNKSNHKIKTLTRRLPTHNALVSHFSNIADNYEEARKHLTGTEYLFSFFINTQNSSRKKAVRFLKTLDERLFHSNDPNDYLIRFGAMLNTMHEIENEYKLTSPTHSHLYKE